MEKIRWSQWMGLVPFVILIFLLLFGYYVTGITTILNLIFISLLLLFCISTGLFADKLFEFGEMNMKDDVELLNLEKDNASILWAFSSGIGIAFLIPGVPLISTKPLMVMGGLLLLAVGGLIYQMFYYPRYAFLVRKRIIVLDLAKKKKK